MKTEDDTARRNADGDLVSCTCGAELRWDALATGTTCGGLELQGALICAAGCGMMYLARGRSRPVERWKIARGGRSVDTGVTRIRFEEAEPALVSRVARLPDLERALRAIAAGAPDAATLARTALDGK